MDTTTTYRRICAYCKSDMGPAGDNYTGDTHGICPGCKSILIDGAWDQARSQGAVWVSYKLRSFYRPCDGGVEVAVVDPAGRLGPWQRDWRCYPPESARKI